MRGLRIAAIVTAVWMTAGAILIGQTTPTAADLAKRLQARYDTIRDFSGEFTQTYQGTLVRKGTTESGKLLVKKPSRVRFTYSTPEKKEFVSDGVRFYSYYPKNRQGSQAPLPKADEGSTALLFLAGHGNLTRDFTSSMAATQPEGEWHLRLVPKTPQADFDTLTLIVDRATLILRGFVTVNDQGTNTIRFKNLKENTGIKDDAFYFQFPPGTEISR
jgi:outer membrane lipoprotein carrier protein